MISLNIVFISLNIVFLISDFPHFYSLSFFNLILVNDFVMTIIMDYLFVPVVIIQEIYFVFFIDSGYQLIARYPLLYPLKTS